MTDFSPLICRDSDNGAYGVEFVLSTIARSECQDADRSQNSETNVIRTADESHVEGSFEQRLLSGPNIGSKYSVDGANRIEDPANVHMMDVSVPNTPDDICGAHPEHLFVSLHSALLLHKNNALT